MIFLFENLRTADKYLITQIILAMILSKNENNHKTINIIFIEHSKLIKEILFCCAEGENVFTITAILHSIEKYSNFDFDKELIYEYVLLHFQQHPCNSSFHPLIVFFDLNVCFWMKFHHQCMII